MHSRLKLLNPAGYLQAFREILDLLTRHRQLTWEMTKREISDRYAGQVFGVLWAIGHPLILMVVYIFIFGFIFKVNMGGEHQRSADYAIYLLSGLIPWLSFQDSMVKGSTAIVAHANLVKQVVFPIEVLPVKGALSCILTQMIFTIMLLFFLLLVKGGIPWTCILIPFLFLFQCMSMIGVSYIAASIGAYFRDLKDFVTVFCVIGIYFMPVFYLPGMAPALFKPVLYANPFSYMGWCFQDALFFGRIEHPYAWSIFPVGSIVIFCFGYRVFRRLKTMFGNVL